MSWPLLCERWARGALQGGAELRPFKVAALQLELRTGESQPMTSFPGSWGLQGGDAQTDPTGACCWGLWTGALGGDAAVSPLGCAAPGSPESAPRPSGRQTTGCGSVPREGSYIADHERSVKPDIGTSLDTEFEEHCR